MIFVIIIQTLFKYFGSFIVKIISNLFDFIISILPNILTILSVLVGLIIEYILNFFFFIPRLMIYSLPNLAIFILPPDLKEHGYRLVYLSISIFPYAELLPLMILSITLMFAKVIVAILMRLKSFIPTMGA